MHVSHVNGRELVMAVFFTDGLRNGTLCVLLSELQTAIVHSGYHTSVNHNSML